MNVHQTHPKGTRGTLWFQNPEGRATFDRVTGLIIGLSIAAFVAAIATIAYLP
jgi:hypothetical protein